MEDKYLYAKLLMSKGMTVEQACDEANLSIQEYQKLENQDVMEVQNVERTISLKILLLTAMIISLGVIMASFILKV